MAKAATRRIGDALKSIFPRREIYVRTAGEVHYLAISPMVQMVGCGLLFTGLAWGSFASVCALFPTAALSAKTRQVVELRTALTDLTRSHDNLEKRLMDAIERQEANRMRADTAAMARDEQEKLRRDLELRLAGAEAERDKLGAQRIALENRISSLETVIATPAIGQSAVARALAERDAALNEEGDLKQRIAVLEATPDRGPKAVELESLIHDRDEARAESAGLRARLAETENEVRSSGEAAAKVTLMMQERNEAKLAAAEAEKRARDLEGAVKADHVRLAELEQAQGQLQATIADLRERRDTAERARDENAGRAAQLEAKLANIESEQGAFLNKLEETTGTTVKEIEKLIKATGLKIEDLVDMPKLALKSGQGGPLKAMSKADLAAFAKATASDESDIEVRLSRLTSQLTHLSGLKSALASLPLKAPLEDYELSSGFGPREDPFTGKLAMHEGLDLRAERHTPVRATARGRVVFAARDGAYGKMVEIDHGHGISTRYGHLDRMDVNEGDTVEVGDVVGLLGNTGRSTGSHVHYEVLLNGEPRNPQKFLEAADHVLKK